MSLVKQIGFLISVFLACACTIQARITDLTSSGTFLYSLSGHSDFGTTSTTTYTSTKQSISLVPTISGKVTSFSVSPSLPSGLTLDSVTGVISGRPTTATLSGNYVITGTASDGSSSTQTLSFEVAGYYLVNSTADASDASAGDKVCATAASNCSIRAALEESGAQTAGTLALIDLPAGTYSGLTAVLSITSRVILAGAGSASSIIDGTGRTQIVNVASTAGEVVVSGLTLRNASDAVNAIVTGVGIRATNSSLTLKNCEISNNSVSGANAMFGIGIGLSYAPSVRGKLNIENCLINGNTNTGTNANLSSNGVGIYAGSSDITISNSTFTNNVANINTGGSASSRGGGLFVGGSAGSESSLSLTNSVVSSNNSTGGSSGLINGGGGIFISGYVYNPIITGVTCNSNTSNRYGGCLMIEGVAGSSFDYTTITETSVSGNTAPLGGNAIYTRYSDLFIVRSSMTGGGDMISMNLSNDLVSTFTNSTFYATANNSLYLNTFGNNVKLEHCTVSNAVGTAVAGNSNVTFKNSVLQRGGGNTCNITGTITSEGYNVGRDATCGLTGTGDVQNSATIGLSALASNGGTTQTMAIGTGSSAYNLVPAGSCSLTTDQRGSARPSGGACDAGAYEY